MTTNVADAWLGTGLSFPLQPEQTGLLPTIDGMDLVRQSIEMILNTEPGERIMLPDFGCGLRRYLMETNSLMIRSAMERDITTALEKWEPRIQLTNVAVTPGEEPSLVWIEIAYVRVADRKPDNLVYPFYLT
jgi:phage baseplate assembly protein W